ncbi:hypothetical protein C7S16_4883 [Burkholderia thailandensis]|uniref:Uncharacterized protein n=1 Tax=Burkholderia thailandensis TaxID=57975 RepID=A0AAW9CJW9_BURTH|nr:hypothetical protein [Burkholderia thailandensis]MDW9250935.1 hypothetical protein [Burkholderia thailandensis]
MKRRECQDMYPEAHSPEFENSNERAILLFSSTHARPLYD